MPLDPKIQIGAELAIGLAGLFIPGTTTTALAAIYAAVRQWNADNGKPEDYVPTREEWDAFIAERESRRIPPAPTG